ncbi:hypothetical protein FRC19_008525 [Serendipita sp. 401]|nr:hypothetical protein FRC15_008863 [Serendipita sp. 397]KAG8797693.1 hypothetical protein FRC16_008606 [Serendipita sp. 398]KAG8826595.1 hypothetical protein FRC19_008525 [Serendipita sp. 401]KAG9057190.1 hypothetical protein FS842_008304 [Serendipita sp. 407]
MKELCEELISLNKTIQTTCTIEIETREKTIAWRVRDPFSISSYKEGMKSNGTFGTRAGISSVHYDYSTIDRGRAATSESGRNNDNRSTRLQALSPSQSEH